MRDNEATFGAAVLGKTLMDCAAQRIFPAMRTLVAIPLWKKPIFLQHLEDLMICGSHFFRHCPLPLGTNHPLAGWKQHKWTTYVFDLLMLSSRPFARHAVSHALAPHLSWTSSSWLNWLPRRWNAVSQLPKKLRWQKSDICGVDARLPRPATTHQGTQPGKPSGSRQGNQIQRVHTRKQWSRQTTGEPWIVAPARLPRPTTTRQGTQLGSHEAVEKERTRGWPDIQKGFGIDEKVCTLEQPWRRLGLLLWQTKPHQAFSWNHCVRRGHHVQPSSEHWACHPSAPKQHQSHSHSRSSTVP